MNVVFMDTSILTNLLDIPGKNQDKDTVVKAFKEIRQRGDTLILPIAAIIETGNHIAHLPAGEQRRYCALRFSEYLRKTAREEAPWTLYGAALDAADMEYLAEHFANWATMAIGIGDLSIVRQYERYIDTMPTGKIRIWSMDSHLAAYEKDCTGKKRRKDS